MPMHKSVQWLQNLRGSRGSIDGNRKMHSEKKEEEATPVEFVTVHGGEHGESYDLPRNIFNSSMFKSFRGDEEVLKQKPAGLYFSVDDFINMLTLARAQITKARGH